MTHYGFGPGSAGTAYFTLHAGRDHEHAAEARVLLERHARPEDGDPGRGGCRASAQRELGAARRRRSPALAGEIGPASPAPGPAETARAAARRPLRHAHRGCGEQSASAFTPRITAPSAGPTMKPSCQRRPVQRHVPGRQLLRSEIGGRAVRTRRRLSTRRRRPGPRAGRPRRRRVARTHATGCSRASTRILDVAGRRASAWRGLFRNE